MRNHVNFVPKKRSIKFRHKKADNKNGIGVLAMGKARIKLLQ